jgi:presenilin-like A22 family membrane protease
MKEERNLPILMLAFIASQILSVIFIQNLIVSQAPVEQYAPFGNENVAQATANSGLLIVSVAVFTLFLILVLKFKLKFIFKFAVIVMPLIFFLGYTDYHLTTLLSYFTGQDFTAAATVITLFFTFAVIYGLIKKIHLLVTCAVVLLTAEIASFLAISLAPPTLYILPVAFALYDIYAVFRGPLKKLIKVQPKKSLQQQFIYSDFGLIITRIAGFTIGAGDFIFYSLLVGAGFIQKSFLGAIVVGVAINFGIIATLYILQKYKKPLPGLPIPVFLAIAVLVLLSFIK